MVIYIWCWKRDFRREVGYNPLLCLASQRFIRLDFIKIKIKKSKQLVEYCRFRHGMVTRLLKLASSQPRFAVAQKSNHPARLVDLLNGHAELIVFNKLAAVRTTGQALDRPEDARSPKEQQSTSGVSYFLYLSFCYLVRGQTARRARGQRQRRRGGEGVKHSA